MTTMTTQARFLDCYEAVADRTSRMLQAARASDWSAFERSERECRAWIERIEMMGDPNAVLDAQGRRRRLELVSRVLRDDAALRDLMQPAFGRVIRCLTSHRARHAAP